MFDDTTLTVQSTHAYAYPLNRKFSRPTPDQPPTVSIGPGPWPVHLTFDVLNRGTGTPVVVWRNPRVVLRTPASLPGPFEPIAITRTRVPGPILKTFPLREILPASEIARLRFGASVDGTPVGPNDFAATAALQFEINVDHENYLAELHTDVELGAARDAVIRVMVSNRPDGVARMAGQRVFMGDPKSAGYRKFRAGIAEFVALLPPNSHGEPNPADKDPVPAPFDNTYNSPEHDAFVIKVKYQRTDEFFTKNMVDGEEREALERAWNDLFGSWPYHDAYLGMLLDHYGVDSGGRRMEDMTPARVAALPREARPHVLRLKAHYDAVTPGVAPRRGRARAGRAGLREPRVAPSPRSGGAGGPARVLSRVAHRPPPRPRRRRASARGPRPDVARVPLPRGDRARRRRVGARRLGAGQPPELLPVVLDSRRRAAPRRGGRRAAATPRSSRARSGA